MRNPFRMLAFAAVAATAFAAAPAAQAQTNSLAEKGHLIVEANRLLGALAYQSTKETTTNGNTSVPLTSSWTTIGLSGSSPLGTVHSIPRFGADYTVIDRLTIGADVLFYFTVGASQDIAQGNVTVSGPGTKVSAVGLSPRVGYILPITDAIAFWPRGGLSFSEIFVGGNDSTTTQFALDLEPLFVLAPVEHFGFTLGPIADIPITGTRSTNRTGPNGTTVSTSNDSAQFYLGLNAGLMGWF